MTCGLRTASNWVLEILAIMVDLANCVVAKFKKNMNHVMLKWVYIKRKEENAQRIVGIGTNRLGYLRRVD